jgi:lysophospholipase L1-like esterase
MRPGIGGTLAGFLFAAVAGFGPTDTLVAGQSMQRIRIVAMGDSTTAGTPAWKSRVEAPPSGSGDETSQYAYWLMRAEPSWEVINQGVNGERSDQILARFDRDVIAQKPAAVVIIAGVNDVYQGRTAGHVVEQLRTMYDRAKGSKIPVVAGTIIPYNTATPDQNARMHEINAWIRATAAEDPAIAFVDTRAAASASGNLDRLFESPDELHPSPAGYRRMADAILPVLRDVLKERPVNKE